MASETRISQHVVQRNPDNSYATHAAQKSADRNLPLIIQSLPNELLAIILHMSLPLDLDGLSFYSPDPCFGYLASLHSFRSVCAAWRDLVDGTPYLWSVACAALPMRVNAALFARSGQSQMIIHLDHASKKAPTLDEFMRLALRHRNRWGTAAFQLLNGQVESVDRYLADPAPQLQNIMVKLDPQHPQAPWTGPGINLLSGQTQNIRNLNICATPIQWLPNAFAGLKSLKLTGIGTHTGGGLSAQYIVDILACSPTLEILDLFGTEVDPTPIETGSSRLHLPLLTSLRLRAVSVMGADCILRRMTVEPRTMTRLELELTHDGPDFDESHFLSETLTPFAPAYDQLNKRCGGSTLMYDRQEYFIWKAQDDERNHFACNLHITIPTGLPWLEQAVGVDGPGIFLPLHLDGLTEGSRAAEDFAALQSSRIVTEMSVYVGSNKSCLDMFLDAISGRAGPQTEVATIPAFQALDTITLLDWTWNLDEIEQALQERFAKRTTMALHLPDLLINILYPTSL